MNTPRLCPLAAAIAAALSGCAVSTQVPEMDTRFGQSVRGAIAAQTLNPNAGKSGGPVAGDGQAGINTLKRHRDTFKEPPPAFTVLGIGGGVQAAQ